VAWGQPGQKVSESPSQHLNGGTHL
jgi:hypothetical protein